MPLVSEVADVINSLRDVVGGTREIIEAVNDGRKFLKREYPDATSDLDSLLQQMQRAIEGLARVTRVISGFRFTLHGDSFDPAGANYDLARFNDYVLKQQEDVAALRGELRQLKADCDKVRELRDKLDARAQPGSWSMFTLFGGKARDRAAELAGTLSNFYADDQRMIELLENTLQIATKALQEVVDSLGPPGAQSPYQIPSAATTLGSYALLFRGPQEELDRLADKMADARMALRG